MVYCLPAPTRHETRTTQEPYGKLVPAIVPLTFLVVNLIVGAIRQVRSKCCPPSTEIGILARRAAGTIDDLLGRRY